MFISKQKFRRFPCCRFIHFHLRCVSLNPPPPPPPDNLITPNVLFYSTSQFLPLTCSLYSHLISIAVLVHPLRDVKVVMPNAVKRGDNVTVECRFDMEGDSLYSVKWYKRRREFFRYTPKEIPPGRIFPVAGVQINVSPSLLGDRKCTRPQSNRN